MAKSRAIINTTDGKVFNTQSEAEKFYSIPSGMISDGIRLGRPVHGQVFKRYSDYMEERRQAAPVVDDIEVADAKSNEVKVERFPKEVVTKLNQYGIRKLKNYRYIVAMWQLIHPDEMYFLDVYLKEAIEKGCPKDGIMYVSDRWTTFDQLNNDVLIKQLNKILTKLDRYFEERKS